MRFILSAAAFLSFSVVAHASLQTDLDQAMATYKIRIQVAFDEYNRDAALADARLAERIRQIDQEKFEEDASYGNEEYNKASAQRDIELAEAQVEYNSKVEVAAGLYKSEANGACRKHTGRNCRW